MRKQKRNVEKLFEQTFCEYIDVLVVKVSLWKFLFAVSVRARPPPPSRPLFTHWYVHVGPSSQLMIFLDYHDHM